jgi:(1->4)-alpha-D-glucan 1-alpha-D-glucosylmutase
LLYQALLGAWAPGASAPSGPDRKLIERLQAFAIKAAREGKEQTSWLDPDERYEAGLEQFIHDLLDRDRSGPFIDSFGAFAQRVSLMGALNSLTQVTLKATMPGVPDFYQGTEFWDLSLVDPDNRRPVDFAARARAWQSLSGGIDWAALAAAWPDGRIKLALTGRLLAIRRELAPVFTDGDHHALEVEGPDRHEIVAFARHQGGEAVLVIAARLFARATRGGRQWPSDWNAAVSVAGFSALQQLLTAPQVLQGPRLAVAELFGTLPVAVLRGRDMGGGN